MSKWIVDIHGDIEGDYDLICKADDVLDKIRAEIEELDRYFDNDYFSTNNCPMYKCNEVLLIIDKYRGEEV